MVYKYFMTSFILIPWFLFWLPTILVTFLIAFSEILTQIFCSYRVKTRRLGYSYKISLKILLLLQKLEVVMQGIRYTEVHDYVCKCDRAKPSEEQTKFKVRFLTAPEQAKVRDGMYSVEGVGGNRKEALKTGSTVFEALKIGLKGWENFRYTPKDEETIGEEIPFSVENFSCIPPAERDEIANYIRGESE